MDGARSLETVAVHAGRPPAEPGNPMNTPPALMSMLHAGAPLEYGRSTNPTWEAFEVALGALEGGQAVAFASGMAAVSAVLAVTTETCHVVVPDGAYLGTRELAGTLPGVDVTSVDVTDTAEVIAVARPRSLVWVESPTNPLLDVADLPALIAGAHERGARVAVDNTLATPLLQRPLEDGAELVVHSVTKFLAGHSDLLLGAVVTRDAELRDALAEHRSRHGAIPGPFETWLALRGLRTLHVRLERAQASAQVLADRLAHHPAVTRVRYPGFGALVSFELASAAAADALCGKVRVAVHATSLGGVETTLERRARQPGDEHVPAGLIRMSVGIEHAEDLWADLEQALP